MKNLTRPVTVVALALLGSGLAACGNAPAQSLPATAPAAPSPAATESAQEVNTRVEKSIVDVNIQFTGTVNIPVDDGYEVLAEDVTVSYGCTGFFVSTSGHVATAGHCLSPAGVAEDIITTEVAALVDGDALTQEEADAYVDTWLTTWVVTGSDGTATLDREVNVTQPGGVPGAALTTWRLGNVLDYRDFEEGDVALVKVENVESTPLSFAAADPELGATVVSIGFPQEVSRISDTAQQRASFKAGAVSSRPVGTNGVPRIEISADLGHGMSGGPTIDAQGRVLGINSRLDENFSFITDTTDTRDWLTSHGAAAPDPAPAATIAPAPPVTPPAASAGTDRWIIIAGVATAFVALVLVALAAVLLRRRGTRAAMPTSPAVLPICQSCGQAHLPGTACSPMTTGGLYR